MVTIPGDTVGMVQPHGGGPGLSILMGVSKVDCGLDFPQFLMFTFFCVENFMF